MDLFSGVIGEKRGPRTGQVSSQSDSSLLLLFGESKDEALRRIALVRWCLDESLALPGEPLFLPRILVNCRLYGRFPNRTVRMDLTADVEALESRGIFQKADGSKMYLVHPPERWAYSYQEAYKVW